MLAHRLFQALLAFILLRFATPLPANNYQPGVIALQPSSGRFRYYLRFLPTNLTTNLRFLQSLPETRHTWH